MSRLFRQQFLNCFQQNPHGNAIILVVIENPLPHGGIPRFDPYDCPRRPYDRQLREPLEKDDVKSMLENMLDYSRNPNLKAGRIEDKGVFYEAEITTKEGSLVDKLLVDKNTGRMRSVY